MQDRSAAGAASVSGQLVIQPDADDIVANLGLATQRRNGVYIDGNSRRIGVTDRAEIEMQIFGFGGPIAEQPCFDAATGDPATIRSLERGGEITGEVREDFGLL